MPRGQPSKYTQKLAAQFCERVADGGTVTEICKADDMPCRATIFNWLRDKEEFLDQYVRAKEMQAERMADEILEIADDGTNDFVERKSADGSAYEVFSAEHVQRSRLRVDARKWLMSKMLPKKYGDKTEVEHTGEAFQGFGIIPPANREPKQEV
ncbi:hypothetical protein HBA54_03245 [Pelagibius litoralis]|uniref:Terminase small subunit n=1 Tax=Pelagibius litoralis TaxID=374515 RepID=A0A967C221_9PROT|nr:hypothetical protein [Pelagibius litoralis]NIA67598.1 hypothetical protein [Pelagibius litoralis]